MDKDRINCRPQFMEQRPYDLAVAARFSGSQRNKLRHVQLLYSQGEVLFSFEYDVKDQRFNNDQHEFEHTAIKSLLDEVKSRVLHKTDFVVWFHSKEELSVVVEITERFAELHHLYKRYSKALLEKAQLVMTTE
jgi:hypothetical protein